MIAIDTNLLVYAHRAGAAEHETARKAIERASADPRGWAIPDSCIAELWSVVTHPSIPGGASSPAMVARFIDALIDAGAKLIVPRESTTSRMIELAKRMKITGPRIFDLRIALTAIDNGCEEIWTRDEGFVRVEGLRVVSPASRA